MRRLLASSVLLVLLAGCCSALAPSPGHPLRVRILTYNIHAGIGTDKKLDLARTANVIRECAPDVVALQELDVKTARTNGIDQPAELGRLTGMHVLFGRTIDYKGGQYGIAVLSRHPVADVKVQGLPSSPSREPRAALSARISPGAGWAPFLFVCTHLDATGDNQDALPQTEALNDLFATGDQLVILAGDFNKQPGTPAIRRLTRFWGDATALNPGPTCPADQPTARIDHVFFRPRNRWRVTEAQVIDERIASDHRPLLVVLEVSAR
jgi:endonuclease/exonuclease/phosphatase family metal-dependent hydrolase